MIKTSVISERYILPKIVIKKTKPKDVLKVIYLTFIDVDGHGCPRKIAECHNDSLFRDVGWGFSSNFDKVFLRRWKNNSIELNLSTY